MHGDVSRGGVLREIGLEARHIARAIATRAREAPRLLRETVAAR